MTPCVFSQTRRTEECQMNLVSTRYPRVKYVNVINKFLENNIIKSNILHLKESKSTNDLYIIFGAALLLSLNSKFYLSNNKMNHHRIPYFFTEALLNFFPGICRVLLGFKNYFISSYIYRKLKCISPAKMISQEVEINHFSMARLSEVYKVKCSLESSSEIRNSDPQAECKQSMISGFDKSKVHCFIQSKKKSDMNCLDCEMVNKGNSEVNRVPKNRRKRMHKRRRKIAVKTPKVCNKPKVVISLDVEINIGDHNSKDIQNQLVTQESGSLDPTFAAPREDEVHAFDSSFSEATDSEDSEFCKVFANNEHTFDSSFSESTDSEDSEFSVVFEDHMLALNTSFCDSTDSDDEFSAVSQGHVHALDSSFTDSTDSEDEFSIVFQEDVCALNSSLSEEIDTVDGEFFEVKKSDAFEVASKMPLFLSSELLTVHKSEFDINLEPRRIQSTKFHMVCESDSESDNCFLEDDFLLKPDKFHSRSSCISNIHQSFVINPSNIQVPFQNEENAAITEVNKKWKNMTDDLNLKPKLPTQVSFAPESDLVLIFTVEACDRKGEWEQFALDRMRFRRRISEVEKILSPCLSPVHREKIYKKLSAYVS